MWLFAYVSLCQYQFHNLSFSWRGLGFTIAVVLGLAFIERPSSLTYTSDIRFKPKPWEPPCGLTEGIEIGCLCIFILDVTVKVEIQKYSVDYWDSIKQVVHLKKLNSVIICHSSPYDRVKQTSFVKWLKLLNIILKNILDVLCVLQGYLIGWEEFRMNKWLIGYMVVIAASVIDWMLSISMLCSEVSL